MALADDDQVIVKKLPTPKDREDFYDLKIKPQLQGANAPDFRNIFVNSADSYRTINDAINTVLKNELDLANKKGATGMMIRNNVRAVLQGIESGEDYLAEAGKRKRKARKTRRRKTKRSTRRS